MFGAAQSWHWPMVEKVVPVQLTHCAVRSPLGPVPAPHAEHVVLSALTTFGASQVGSRHQSSSTSRLRMPRTLCDQHSAPHQESKQSTSDEHHRRCSERHIVGIDQSWRRSFLCSLCTACDQCWDPCQRRIWSTTCAAVLTTFGSAQSWH